MLTDFSVQRLCERCLGSDCHFHWQLAGSSMARLADILLNYCGKNSPFYIVSFVVIFRNVTLTLIKDLLCVLYSFIGQMHIPFKCYFIHVLLHTCKTGVGIV